MADKTETWKKFTNAMKQKRTGTKVTKAPKFKGKERDIGELTVQR